MKLIFFNFKNRVKKAWQVWVIVFKAIADLFFFHALLFAVCSIFAVLIYKFILFDMYLEMPVIALLGIAMCIAI